MKKAFLRFLSIFVIGCLFFSCNPSTGDVSGEDQKIQEIIDINNGDKTDNDKTQNDDKDKAIPALKRNVSVKFDFSGAQALAKLESKQDGSRAVTNADELGDLVKILADGSMENAVTVGENSSLSDIVAIYKSPLEESKDIFIVFNGESILGYEEVEREYDWGGTYTDRQDIRAGQLICLHEDGSISDILKKDNPTDNWNTYMSLKTESVTFDAAGNLYFISSDNGDMIYQYNPQADELTKMVAAVENTTYEKMQIDDEGEWIFVSGSRWSGSSSYFLRAIPISNPNGFKNIYYSSDNSIYAEKWVYDNKNGDVWCIVRNGNQEGLFCATKTDGFKTIKYIGDQTSVGDENYTGENIFESFYNYCSDYNWEYSFLDENDEFSASKVVDRILDLLNFYVAGYEKETKEWVDWKTLTRDDVDIRFDKFENETGQLGIIYLLTKGKKNEEAFDALNCWAGKQALREITYLDYFSENKGYKHNFLADILYIKNTDTLLCDSEDVLLSYYKNLDYEYNSESDSYESIYSDEKTITGQNWFSKKTNGNYESNVNISFVGAGTGEGTCINYCYSKDISQILDYFFSFCNVKGDKEFRLSGFKDDQQYNCLYSELTDEAALEWLSSDIERLSIFGKALGLYKYDYWEGNTYITNNFVIPYYGLISFIAKTCYIKGSNQKAVSENRVQNLRIPYSRDSSWFYEGYGRGNLSVTDEGVFYQFTNLYDNWYSSSSSKPYYFIVQIADSDGVFVENVNEIVLPMGKVVSSLKSDNRIFMQYSLLNETGGELGYHHIYSVDLSTGEVVNHFENVPNSRSLEVITYNSAGTNLYFSAVRGTTVENMIVNLLTNEYNPLSVQRKMVAVYTFN